MELPDESGTYILIVLVLQMKRLKIGRLGTHDLHPGFYAYVGSASGPGGLRARLRHHLESVAEPHWHIDYLRPHTCLDRIWYSHDRVRREHQWARIIHALRGASVPAAGFGSSDCRCQAHLFYFATRPSLRCLADSFTFRV